MIDTAGTTHAIATTAEAAVIGGTTGGNTKCILKSQISNYGCSLKSPVPSGTSYLENQAVQWYDLMKADTTIYVTNDVFSSSIQYAIDRDEGANWDYYKLGESPWADWQQYSTSIYHDEITANVNSKGAYHWQSGVAIEVGIVFTDELGNAIYPDTGTVSVKNIECRDASTELIVSKSIWCQWEDPDYPGIGSQDNFIVSACEYLNLSTKIKVTYNYLYNGDIYESVFIVLYNRTSS